MGEFFLTHFVARLYLKFTKHIVAALFESP